MTPRGGLTLNQRMKRRQEKVKLGEDIWWWENVEVIACCLYFLAEIKRNHQLTRKKLNLGSNGPVYLGSKPCILSEEVTKITQIPISHNFSLWFLILTATSLSLSFSRCHIGIPFCLLPSMKSKFYRDYFFIFIF